MAMIHPGDVTLATYDAAAQRYVNQVPASPSGALIAFLDRLAELVDTGHVLELGSGPGGDATYLEGHGLRVTRTDAALAFVEMMRTAGHEARRLDVCTDELGGPYDAVLADAMLLHLTRDEFEDVLQRTRRAVVNDGVLAFTVKKGDAAAWSDAKLRLPRHFTYWRAPAVREALTRTGWTVIKLDHVAGRIEPWLPSANIAVGRMRWGGHMSRSSGGRPPCAAA
jgi:SAM-dependent methyltransferase